MQGMAEWLLRSATYADHVLKDHPKKAAFCEELRLDAIALARLHGQCLGGIQALKPATRILPEAQARIDSIRHQYAEFRAIHIEIICQRYIEAVAMLREVNTRPGRPHLRIPDSEKLKDLKDSKSIRRFAQYSWEFAIAVKLADRKRETGRYSGPNDLLSEAIEVGHMDDDGDTAQRIKRLAKQIHAGKNLYLSPGLRAARASAGLFIYSGE